MSRVHSRVRAANNDKYENLGGEEKLASPLASFNQEKDLRLMSSFWTVALTYDFHQYGYKSFSWLWSRCVRLFFPGSDSLHQAEHINKSQVRLFLPMLYESRSPRSSTLQEPLPGKGFVPFHLESLIPDAAL